jgi:hypothetical protein
MSQQLLQTVIVASYFSRRVARDSDAHKNQAVTYFEVVSKKQDQVKSLYRICAETNQGIFFVENEQVGSSPTKSKCSGGAQQNARN